ncbi:hypothetical protein FACS189452_05140 [Bacteroidia bacterium]|nr:hypothetical protein FACS189452_05140 [Bacteroidia bacterium]
MITIKQYCIAIVAVLQLSVAAAWGQTLVNMNDYRALFRNAQEMYEKQMYSTAQQSFARLLDNKNAVVQYGGEQWLAQIAFYDADCSYQLGSVDAEMQLKKFIADYPQSARVSDVYYLLSKLYFRNNRYTEAISGFETFDAASLRDVDVPEYYFKYGYALFTQQRFDEASAQFSKVKDGESRYASAALYYFSHIAYDQKHYNVALDGFEQLRDDDMFSKLMPYYILHIYHLQRKYDKVIEEGNDELVASISSKRLPEISRIIGEAYYFKQQYGKALPYIEKFIETAPSLTRSDRYLLGYIYYQNKEYPKAAKLFEQIVAGSDSVAQMAYYYLADSWLQVKEKYSAGRAFQQASRMDFLPEIKEDAMYNYAKLMFELRSGPFNDAVEALTQYQQAYPKSAHADEVNRYLMQAYIWSHNYKAAWASLKSIKKPDAEVLAMMQKTAYYLAIELIQSQQFVEAVAYIDTSLRYAAHNPAIASLSIYWRGEAQFRMQAYEDAKNSFSKFVVSPAVFQTEEYKTAHYNLAYCYYKLRNGDTAHVWFRKFVALKSVLPQLVSDAYCRMGDYNFSRHNYTQAIEDYQRVMTANLVNVDYAMFQSGLCYGLTENTNKKLEMMNKVIAYLPKSLYTDNAQFEIGRTYVQLQDYPKAIAAYQQLQRKKNSVFYSKTLIELGLIYVNQGKPNEAMTYYKQAVTEFPGTAEMRTALAGVRNIYVELGDADGYFKYAGAFNGGVEMTEKDSISFAAAEHAYSIENHDLTASLLTRYINDFPQGAFLLDAHFYLADEYLRTHQDAAAIPHFEAVLNYPKSDYTENALDALSALTFNFEQYEKSTAYYAQLIEMASSNATLIKARRGKVLSDYLLKNYTGAIAEATELLAVKNLSPELEKEIHYVRAKCYEQTDTTGTAAMADFTLVAKDTKSKEGAEAQYKIIESIFKQGNLDKVEKEVISFSKSGTPHQYWIARAFILLGDVYVQRDDAFQAKATYESIIDGYNNADDGIKDAVQQRVQQLLALASEKDKDAAQSQHEIAVDEGGAY